MTKIQIIGSLPFPEEISQFQSTETQGVNLTFEVCDTTERFTIKYVTTRNFEPYHNHRKELFGLYMKACNIDKTILSINTNHMLYKPFEATLYKDESGTTLITHDKSGRVI